MFSGQSPETNFEYNDQLEGGGGQIHVNRQFDICITVFIRGKKHLIKTYLGEYRNLMMLLYDKFYIDDFGECKGTGRCGTCHVQVSGNYAGLLSRVANENSTLCKMTGVTANSRLACQMTIDEKLDGLVIQVIAEAEQ